MLSVNAIMTDRKVSELLALWPYAVSAFDALNLPAPASTVTLAEWLAATPEARFLEYGLTRRTFATRFVAMVQTLSEGSKPEKPHVESLTIQGGFDKNGKPESLEITFHPGDTVCLVGPTGAGKSRLLSDIECLAQRDTISRRLVTVTGENCDSAQGSAMIAQLSQSMNFVTDLPVMDFLRLHAESTGIVEPESVIRRVLETALSLAGESFSPDISLTQLSGGQTRALMIADIAWISAAPIVLIDEIENAGIDKNRAIALLHRKGKLLFISTHDPVLALSCGIRLLIREGAVIQHIEQTEEDRRNAAVLSEIDRDLAQIRDCLRNGAPIPNVRKRIVLEDCNGE